MSTGVDSRGQGREHMEQVCGVEAWLIWLKLMSVLRLAEAFVPFHIGHTAEAQRFWKAWLR